LISGYDHSCTTASQSRCALVDWLENGLDGLAPTTAYRSTIAKPLRRELGLVELTKMAAVVRYQVLL